MTDVCLSTLTTADDPFRKSYSPTKFLVPPTILGRVRSRVRVRVRGSEGRGLGFWNLVGEIRDLVGE